MIEVTLPALTVVGSLGVASAALALGIRHGIDWDHIAAITDITSSTTGDVKEDERWLVEEPRVMLTDESHHGIGHEHEDDEDEEDALAPASTLATPAAAAAVAVDAHAHGRLPLHHPHRHTHDGEAPAGQLGALGRLVSRQRPAMLLGTMYALGHGSMVTVLGLLAILASEVLPSWIDPIMERVVGATLIFLAIYLFYAVYRFFRGGEEFRLRSRWMLIFSGARSLFQKARSRLGGSDVHEHPRSDSYGVRTAYTVGLIHGIGAETGTQVLIIGTAVGADSKAMGVVALLAFVVGLLISNSVITVMSSAGFVGARRRQLIYVGAGLFAAIFSLILGVIFLFEVGTELPDLSKYFEWIGGPEN